MIKNLSFSLFVFSFLTLSICSLSHANCNIPEDLEKKLEPNNRAACIKQAEFLMTKPDLTLQQILSGPILKSPAFNNQDTVYCRYFYRYQNGSSDKFRCYRTNEKNQLFDSKGILQTKASQVIVSEDGDDGLLADKNGNILTNEKGKALKADVLKVRFQNTDSDADLRRNREAFASTAATRIAWSMGIPSENYYPTKAVVCFGCEQNPWKKGLEPQLESVDNIATFPYAAIERKFDGKRVMKAFMSQDKKVRNIPWKWTEYIAQWSQLSHEQQLGYQVLALFANFLQVVEERGTQHVMVCEKENVTDDNQCLKPLAALHDIGAAFGSRDPQLIDTVTKNHPRGDLQAYKQVQIFKDNNCSLVIPAGGLISVSEEARQEFVKRASHLDENALLAIVQAASFSKMDESVRKALGGFFKSNVDMKVDKEWARVINSKLNLIREAHCPQRETVSTGIVQ